MDKIPQNHLKFLEFVSNKIYGEGPGWWQLDLLAKEYPISLTLDEVRHMAALYKNKFFKVSTESDLKIFPIPEIRQEIENHGSFSKFLLHKKQVEKSGKIKDFLIKIIGPLIALALLVFNIWSWNQNKKITLELEILKTKIFKSDSANIKKDSIILDLKNKLILVDTIKNKH
jgi:hypothetical protein